MTDRTKSQLVQINDALRAEIARREQVERELRQSEARWRSLANTAVDFILVLDSEGIIRFINRTRPDYTIEQVLGHSAYDFVPPEFRDRMRECIEAVLRTGEIGDFETVTIGPDGPIWYCTRVGPLQHDGQIVGVTLFVRDITERKRAEEALRESESRMRLGLEGSNVGLWDWSIPADEVVFTCHWAEILGYSPEEVPCGGRRWEDYVHPDDRTRVLQAMDDHLAGHTPYYETEHRRRAKSGQWRWLLERGKVIERDPQGHPLRAVGMHLDITDRKSAEEQLRGDEQLLRKLLDLQDKERKLLAYDIHDSLVQDIVGAQLLLAGVRHRLQQRNGPGRQELEAAEDLLTQAINEGRRMISQLRPIVIDEQGILEALHYLANEEKNHGHVRIQFVHQVQFERLPPLLEGVVFRIVQEAISNVKQHSQADCTQIRLTQVGDRICLEIQDQGIGFDPARVPHDRCGLSGIKRRAELFGGSAVIDSAPGRGTCIRVELPIDPKGWAPNGPS